ncbi:MAG: response regulator transcription factor [Chlorobi bacterium]|nr:response regulator transcription factor [Chlorobiota bacterium]
MSKKKILVIDDFEPLLEEVTDLLTFEGFKTFSAKDGTEGIQMALQYKPDLIICDIEMPKMNGFEVYKTLEKIPALNSTPFIFLTARAQVEDFKNGLKLGADDYITKPLEMDYLLTSVLKRLGKIERIENKYRKEFEILLHNPLIGIFIYKANQFFLINDKLQDIIGYSKKELNNLKLSEIIISDSEILLRKLKSVSDNIYDSVQVKISIIKKNKKAVFIELFVKYIESENEKGMIGSVIELSSEKLSSGSNSDNSSITEFQKIVDFLNSSGKEEIADEIINVKEIVSFNSDLKKQKLRQKTKLTKRESEILQFICEGYTNVEIAEKLFISNRTVDNHRANLLSKTHTKNTASLVAFAVQNRIVKI